jgi:hypothetical protein
MVGDDYPSEVAVLAGWPHVRSYSAGLNGWYGHAARQLTVYHRLEPAYLQGTPWVEMTTFLVRPTPLDRGGTLVSDRGLLDTLLMNWSGPDPVPFPVSMQIERRVQWVPIDGTPVPMLVVETERSWAAGVQLDEVAITMLGRHHRPGELALEFAPAGEISSV